MALVPAKSAAGVGGMSVSWWLEKVAAKEAPQPAIRAPRCTRWRATDVAEFWRKFAERGSDGAALIAQAKRASAAANAKRFAQTDQAGA